MKIDVGIINYNGGSELLACVKSLLAQTNPVRVFVFDNASTDNSIELLKNSALECIIVESPENLGYAGACNGLLSQMESEIQVLCNMDLEFDPAWASNLLACFGRHPEAGSVASMPFVEEAVDGTLAEVPKEQVICGIPFYTRGWTVPFGTDVPQSEAMGMEQAYDFVTAHDITLSYDDSFGQNVGTSSDSEARYSIWMDDEQSVTNKINLIRQKELAGVAAWRIGFEKASVWSIITGGLE